MPKVLRQILEKIEAQTAKNSKYVLNNAIDYGGNEEIIAVFKKILKKGVKPSAINEKLVSENLETADLPDPDLLIRTSGEKRTSGIMPWQTAYTELFFSKLLFPDFSLAELKRAISDFSHRHRRYGE